MIKIKPVTDVAIIYGKRTLLVMFTRIPDQDVVKEIKDLSLEYPSIVVSENPILHESAGGSASNAIGEVTTSYYVDIPTTFDSHAVVEAIKLTLQEDHNLSCRYEYDERIDQNGGESYAYSMV